MRFVGAAHDAAGRNDYATAKPRCEGWIVVVAIAVAIVVAIVVSLTSVPIAEETARSIKECCLHSNLKSETENDYESSHR